MRNGLLASAARAARRVDVRGDWRPRTSRSPTGPYVRHDGGTDVTIASCSSDVTDPTPDAATPTPAADEGGGERQQNEPAAAVDPLTPSRMTAGSNDYCSVPTTTDAYAGFYYSSDGGTNWTDSLLPGYPTDTSAEGSNCSITPQHCLVINTGDPVQAFDRWGHVFYGVIGFNRAKPQNGSIFAARYDWPRPVDDARLPLHRARRARGAGAVRASSRTRCSSRSTAASTARTRAASRGPGATSTSAGRSSSATTATTASTSAARPTAASRTRSRRRSRRGSTAASSATSASRATAPSTSRGARSRAAAASR